jgi:hypothetical protein
MAHTNAARRAILSPRMQTPHPSRCFGSSKRVGPENVRVEPNVGDPLADESGVLPRCHTPFRATPAGENKFAGLLAGKSWVVVDSLSGLLRQFKSVRLSGLFLSYRCAISRVSARGDILDFDRDDVTATKLAINCQVEHGEVANATLNLELRPNRPDMSGAQAALTQVTLPLFQGHGLFAGAIVFPRPSMVSLLR